VFVLILTYPVGEALDSSLSSTNLYQSKCLYISEDNNFRNHSCLENFNHNTT